MKKLIFLYIFLLPFCGAAQVKVAGVVVDEKGKPLPYVDIGFKGTTIGTISDEKGRFYLQADKYYPVLVFSFLGYRTVEKKVKPRDLHLRVKMVPDAQKLRTVVIAAGKPKNKGNPALAIIRKMRERKHQNGLRRFDYYQYDKYEKIEFDLYVTDSAYTLQMLPEDMQFITRYVDTSRLTGRAFLPAFIHESYYRVYGKNIPPPKRREDLLATKASGFNNPEFTNVYLKDLYHEYDVYEPFIRVFDKKFVSPLSALGPLTYYYVLADTMEIDGLRSFNIIFYPRHKGDLAFKGDMWIADSLFAVQDINLRVSQNASVNWIKDFYLERSYYLYNDSVYLPKRYHVMTELGLENAKALDFLVKKTIIYDKYKLNQPMPADFYDYEPVKPDKAVFHRSEEQWQQWRPEQLSRTETGIYQMLDSLKETKTFKRLSVWSGIVASGYWLWEKWHFDFGPVLSLVGYNEVEGLRLRVGGRTFYDDNDRYRIEGFTAYGFRDKRFKFGFSGKALISLRPRLMISGGYRHDIEQTGVSLSNLNEDELSRNLSASFVLSTGDKTKLTDLRLGQLNITFEPFKNREIKTGFQYKIMHSAHPAFSLAYLDHNGQVRHVLSQPEVYVQVKVTPRRRMAGYGVQRYQVNRNYPVFLLRYTRGFSRSLPDAFDYDKIQFYFDKRILMGWVGRSVVQVEAGKVFGAVPMGLLNVVPGNQSYFFVGKSFQLVNYYEFVTDTYAAFKWMHNFEGRLFNKIPLLSRTKWRTLVFFNTVWGRISDANKQINRTGIPYRAPEKPYMEYGVGITNIFKFLEFDAFWRANYRGPGRQNFGIKMNMRLDF
ncbi:MAG: carboxypeptidase-like regulatory domain-containing protein [Chlorobi bacterium]|nr:carboxypeptidase-like regulatory domain-containing protein [Chlorobiota bacterium]